ncbi:MAG: DUF192 domain-containing protein [Candidatus Aenigmarchaeota archaeon]|nr:DUF192 domain-containing protein [Candidatus Aenigmarchaeota archaeon]
MKNFFRSNIVYISIAILVGVFLFFSISPYFMPSGKVLSKSIVSINGRQISVEIADTPETWTRGLMFHSPLKDNEGMLFVYDRESYYGIWMPNMSFSIDIIWMNNDGKIVNIVRNAEPCKSMPCQSWRTSVPASYVLELKANSTQDFNIGDIFDLSSIN